MKEISVSLLLLTLVSSILIITVEESNATSKAEDTGDKIREGAKDLRKTINEGLRELGKPSNNYNDNENIQNEFDNSKNQGDNNNDKVSIADELRELAQLKKEGIITEEEFTEMKEDLIE